MIITRTPFRISLAGGGTDFPEFYRHEFGCVISTAINKFMYITLNEKFAGDIRVGYSKTEIVQTPDEIQHPIVREAFKLLKVRGLEITSNADVPAGTGLGSSGSFSVGLLNALHIYRNSPLPTEELAREASHVERELAQEITGKQDHYIAAFGGLRYFQFNPDESVLVKVISYPYLSELEESLMLAYIGPRTKSAGSILSEMKANLRMDALKELKKITLKLRAALVAAKPPSVLGEFLNESWMIKKELASGISNPAIDHYYSKALEAGAIGGRLCGAGAGGFLLIYCPKDKQEAVKEALGLRVLPFNFEARGSHVIYDDARMP